MSSEITSVSTWSSLQSAEIKKAKGGLQLTAFKVSWLSFKVSFFKKTWAKIKPQSRWKPKRPSKKQTLTSAQLKTASMAVNCRHGPNSQQNKSRRKTFQRLKMKTIWSRKNSSVSIQNSITKKTNWVWVWKFQKSQEQETSEKAKLTLTTFQSRLSWKNQWNSHLTMKESLTGFQFISESKTMKNVSCISWKDLCQWSWQIQLKTLSLSSSLKFSPN